MNKFQQNLPKLLSLLKRPQVLVLTSVVLGILAFVAVRFVMLGTQAVHYHANFALYVNGQREEFKSFAYYEEIATCGGSLSPKTIVHMHNNVNSAVHVHRPEATWVQFFANLGWTMSDKALISPTGEIYKDGDNGNKLSFYLNGREAGAISNQIIADEDALVINYGSETSDQIKSNYDGLAKDAKQLNAGKDPSACTGSEDMSVASRLKRAIWQ